MVSGRWQIIPATLNKYDEFIQTSFCISILLIETHDLMVIDGGLNITRDWGKTGILQKISCLVSFTMVNVRQ